MRVFLQQLQKYISLQSNTKIKIAVRIMRKTIFHLRKIAMKSVVIICLLITSFLSFALEQNKFSYRGVLLDESRHFFGKEVVFKLLDTMQAYNMNYLHWHLTDDQGWRIEIKKYPLLTEIGAWRTENDGSRYGGFYTQDEIREVIAYAEARNISIMPEIDIPGHSGAAIASYPWISTDSRSIQVPTKMGRVLHNVLAPTDTTISFLKDVFEEICALFPSPYIHIGGDEVPKKIWKNADFYPELLQKHSLKDAEELQSYFLKQIETFIQSKGKRAVVWGEALKGGLSKDMILISWRGRRAGNKAARLGNQVIMSPRQYCYFDYPFSRKGKKPQLYMPILSEKKVAKFHPHSKRLSADENKNIIGAQVALWTEHIDTEEKLWLQLMSRLRVFSKVMNSVEP